MLRIISHAPPDMPLPYVSLSSARDHLVYRSELRQALGKPVLRDGNGPEASRRLPKLDMRWVVSGPSCLALSEPPIMSLLRDYTLMEGPTPVLHRVGTHDSPSNTVILQTLLKDTAGVLVIPTQTAAELGRVVCLHLFSPPFSPLGVIIISTRHPGVPLLHAIPYASVGIPRSLIHAENGTICPVRPARTRSPEPTPPPGRDHLP